MLELEFVEGWAKVLGLDLDVVPMSNPTALLL